MTEVTAPWLSYQHPAVRDLVWLIASAPLLCDEQLCDEQHANAALWPDARMGRAVNEALACEIEHRLFE